MALVNVSAIIVTRGDVDLTRPVASLYPLVDEILIWDNSGNWQTEGEPDPKLRFVGGQDLAVYGRYAAIEYASGDLIFAQDDDCVLPPESIQAIIETWRDAVAYGGVEGRAADPREFLVANMPQSFRHDFYSDHCLVGFGAAFHRDAPTRAWWRFRGGFDETEPWVDFNMEWFHRTCDVVFTALTSRVLVDIPYEDLPWATDDSRMYRQHEHLGDRLKMLDLALKAR